MEEKKAKIREIFYSLQGEGIYIGYPQIFLRFQGCNLEGCRFCDTPDSSYKEYTVEELFRKIISTDKPFHSIAITGGEPLLQVDFLKEFLAHYKKDFKFYLETNGTLPQNLEQIIDYVDIIAMDVKLPSATGLMPFWEEHRNFLRIAWNSNVFVKAVVSKNTNFDDIATACDIIISIDPYIPLILQPESSELDEELIDKLQEFQKKALNFLLHVRIIPQIHKFIYIK